METEKVRPKEIPASDPNYVKHISRLGSEFHRLSYSDEGTHCSEPNCIVNKPHNEEDARTTT